LAQSSKCLGAKSSHRVPVVLSREEVRKIFEEMQGTMWMVVALLYGAGLRLQECLELRVKDLDFSQVSLKQFLDGNGQHRPSVQELLGHSDVSTAMAYLHVLNRGGLGVRSPFDRL
jgi:site-specific recombinase XerD